VATATLFDPSPFPVHIAAEVKGFDPGTHINPKDARRMARCSQLAIVAGREAVVDAGLDWTKEDMERVGVVMGTGIGGIELLIEPIGKFLSETITRITPHTAIESLCNMPAFHVGLELGCLGPLSTLTTACAAGTALGRGEMIRRNER
jgi:3-oxoacyl-[acyl-carrier-protein] synthase II